MKKYNLERLFCALCAAGQVQDKNLGQISLSFPMVLAIPVGLPGPRRHKWRGHGEFLCPSGSPWVGCPDVFTLIVCLCFQLLLTPGRNEWKKQTRLLGCQLQCSRRKNATSRVFLIPQLIAKQWGVGRIKSPVKIESAPILQPSV